MSTAKFDLSASRVEFEAIKTRARELEKAAHDEIKWRLRDLTSGILGLKEIDSFAADVRAFLDEV